MWKTYKEAYGEVLQIGSAIRALGAEPVNIVYTPLPEINLLFIYIVK